MGWSIGDASVSMGLQSSWPVRARTPLLPLPTDYSANAIHICAPNNMPGCQRQRLARGNSPEHRETTFVRRRIRRVADEPGVLRKPVSLQVMRRTLGTAAKINCRTRATLANWRGVLCKRDFVLEYPHSLLLPETSPLTKIRSKENSVWNHSMVYVESLNSDSLSPILTLF